MRAIVFAVMALAGLGATSCGDSYFITTEDGRETPYWEKNIRLKIDSVETGPPKGIAVILGAGMAGDRFSVIFSSLADLKSLIQEKC